MSRYSAIQEMACAANLQLPALGLVEFTFGNVSVADHDNGLFAIKPSGVPYPQLKPEMMVIVDFEGKTVEGKLRPSSDTLTHAVLYKHWPAIGAISHTHSTYATAWAQAGRDIPLYGTTHADHHAGYIPCAPPMADEHIAGNYEEQTGFQIISHLEKEKADYRLLEMILIGNHAPFTWGKTAEKAVYNSAVLESIARLAWITEQINPDAQPMKNSLVKKHFERKHGPGKYYGQ